MKKEEENSIDSVGKNLFNLIRGKKIIIFKNFYRFYEFAIRDKISHDAFKDSLGIFGIDSLSFLSDRMFAAMDHE